MSPTWYIKYNLKVEFMTFLWLGRIITFAQNILKNSIEKLIPKHFQITLTHFEYCVTYGFIMIKNLRIHCLYNIACQYSLHSNTIQIVKCVISVVKIERRAESFQKQWVSHLDLIISKVHYGLLITSFFIEILLSIRFL